MRKKITTILLIILLLTSTGYTAEKEAVIPIDAKLEYNNALDMYKLGEYEKAIASFRTAIRLYPDYIDAYYNLGSILDYLNQGDEAVYVLKQIVTRKPDDYEALYKIAEISLKLGDRINASRYLAQIPPNNEYYIKSKELIHKHNLLNVSAPNRIKSNIPQTSSTYLNITSPTGITSDSQGNVYVASFSDNMILKITPDDKRIVFFKNPILKGPIAITSDNSGNIYIANYNADNVLKLSKNGTPSIFIENAPKPYSLHIGGNMLFVSCQGTNTIIRKKL